MIVTSNHGQLPRCQGLFFGTVWEAGARSACKGGRNVYVEQKLEVENRDKNKNGYRLIPFRDRLFSTAGSQTVTRRSLTKRESFSLVWIRCQAPHGTSRPLPMSTWVKSKPDETTRKQVEFQHVPSDYCRTKWNTNMYKDTQLVKNTFLKHLYSWAVTCAPCVSIVLMT